MKKKLLQIILSAVILVLLGVLIFIPGATGAMDGIVLLEKSRPGYARYLMNAPVIENGQNEDDESSESIENRNIQLSVNKDGFGEVSPDDMTFFLNYMRSNHPGIETINLRFGDGSGIKIDVSNPEETKAAYGTIDESGNFLGEETTLELKQPLIAQIDGLTAYERRYDDHNNVIYEFRKDAEGKGVADKNGIAGYEREFTGKDKTKESFIDAEGNRMMLTAGYSSVCYEYEYGKVASILFLGPDEAPINCINGYAKEEREYNKAGHIVMQRYFDKSEAPVITPYGYAKIQKTYDDNNKVIKEEYFGTAGEPLKQAAGHVAIAQEWENGILISRTYLDSTGKPVNRNDGYSKAKWVQNAEGMAFNVQFEDVDGKPVSIEGLNLVKDIRFGPDGWSEWMIPAKDVANSCITIGSVNLGEKHEGDTYTCYLEIEFKDVRGTEGKPFDFWTQGAQDGKWFTDNVWNMNLAYLKEIPQDGIYAYSSVVAVSGDMADVSNYAVGFRCDYWADGAFRVRNVKVEKGDISIDWNQGL